MSLCATPRHGMKWARSGHRCVDRTVAAPKLPTARLTPHPRVAGTDGRSALTSGVATMSGGQMHALAPHLADRQAVDILWFYLGYEAWHACWSERQWSWDDTTAGDLHTTVWLSCSTRFPPTIKPPTAWRCGGRSGMDTVTSVPGVVERTSNCPPDASTLARIDAIPI
jgi:hypothetical protein